MPILLFRIASEIRSGHTGPVSSTKTAGQVLREDLDKSLPPGVVWTKLELVTLGRLEVLADRLDALGKRADVPSPILTRPRPK